MDVDDENDTVASVPISKLPTADGSEQVAKPADGVTVISTGFGDIDIHDDAARSRIETDMLAHTREADRLEREIQALNQKAADDAAEIDPLDAFMSGVHAKVTQDELKRLQSELKEEKDKLAEAQSTIEKLDRMLRLEELRSRKATMPAPTLIHAETADGRAAKGPVAVVQPAVEASAVSSVAVALRRARERQKLLDEQKERAAEEEKDSSAAADQAAVRGTPPAAAKGGANAGSPKAGDGAATTGDSTISAFWADTQRQLDERDAEKKRKQVAQDAERNHLTAILQGQSRGGLIKRNKDSANTSTTSDPDGWAPPVRGAQPRLDDDDDLMENRLARQRAMSHSNGGQSTAAAPMDVDDAEWVPPTNQKG